MALATILSAAILVEAIIQYGKTIYETFDSGEYKTFVTQLASIVIGILIAFLFKANAFAALGMEVNEIAGTILTGIVISRGSNYASDLLKRIASPENGNEFVYIPEDKEEAP